MAWSPTPALHRPPAEDSFGWAIFGWSALLALHSLRRHLLLFLLLWFGTVLLSTALLAVLPKSYAVQATLQAQRAVALESRDPKAAGEPESAIKQSAATVLRRDNLVALVRQTDLVRQWPLTRAPLMKVKDKIYARLFPPPTQEQQVDAFVGLLQKELWVSTTVSTVTIGLEFPDPELAFQLVDVAVENFLEARHAAEISSIADEISILEARTATAHQALDVSLNDLQAARSAQVAKLGVRSAHPMERDVAALPDQETAQLLVLVQSKRRAIADLEDFRRARIAELETLLAEQRSFHTNTDSAVLELGQSLQAARQESPQVIALRQELEPLEAEVKQRGFLPDFPLQTNRLRESGLRAASLEPTIPHEDDYPDIEYAKSEARHALTRYNDMLDRIENARLEQDNARAAFKYRYEVLWPAQKPQRPKKRNPTAVIPAALIAGLLLAMLGTTLVDVHSRKVVEPWQVEHALGIPLLAVLAAKTLNPGDVASRPAAGRPAPPVDIPPDVQALWHALAVRPWGSLGVIAQDDGAKAWGLVQSLVGVAGRAARPVLRAVNALELTNANANAIAHALSGTAVRPSGEPIHFVAAIASPLENEPATVVMESCDGVVLLLQQGRSRIPEAQKIAELVGRARLLGAILVSG